MRRIPYIGPAKRKRLIRQGRNTGEPDTALRFRIIAKLGAGDGVCEVARMLGCAVSTVSTTASRYLDKGLIGLFDCRANNGSRKVDDAFLQRLVKLLEHCPQHFGWQRPTWTRELLCLEMQQQGFPPVAVCTMGRALCSIGARLGSPKPVVLCPWEKQRKRRVLRRIRRLAKSATASEPVYFSDEVDIHLNPKIGKDWMLRRQQRRVVTPGKNRKYYLAGALNARTGKLVCVGHESKSSPLFCMLLWRLATLHRKARIHLIIDNYCIHKSLCTNRVIRDLKGRIVLHFLPPYCPDDNRIERVWRDLHACVTRNHRCKTLKQLLRYVVTFVEAYNDRKNIKPSLRRCLPAAA